jgi:hypothetical protein
VMVVGVVGGVRMCSGVQCFACRVGWRVLVKMSEVLLSEATPPILMVPST